MRKYIQHTHTDARLRAHLFIPRRKHTHVQLHNFQFQHAAKCVPSDSFVLPLSVCGGSGQNVFLSLTKMIIRNVDTSSEHAKGVAVTHPLCAPLHTVRIHQKDLRVTEHDPQ